MKLPYDLKWKFRRFKRHNKITWLLIRLYLFRGDNRSLAAYTLGDLRTKRAVKPLLRKFRKGVLINEAGESLGKIGDRQAEEPLLNFVRVNCERLDTFYGPVFGLGHLGGPHVVDFLLTLLHSDKLSIDSRHTVVEALGYTGDTRVIKPLLEVLKRKDCYTPKMVESVIEALTTFFNGPSRREVSKEDWEAIRIRFFAEEFGMQLEFVDYYYFESERFKQPLGELWGAMMRL